ncbi:MULTISPECIES: hypothetical protein [unclassified Bradyrhizobium]|uniref:hypothetical protein n=1 Tax=unclassified Bradyrhizobium TaxID=2631580 RepID=UPI00339472CD
MTEHTPFPNFGKVECFCGGRLTAFQVFCPTGDERPSPEASAPQFEQASNNLVYDFFRAVPPFGRRAIFETLPRYPIKDRQGINGEGAT